MCRVSAVLALSNRQNHRTTEADDRYTHATTVGVSKNLVRTRLLTIYQSERERGRKVV